MYPRNVGSDKIVRTYVRLPLPVRRSEILAFQAPARFGGKSYGHPDAKMNTDTR